MGAGICSNCGEPAGKLIRGECRTCYQYGYRNGVPRPEDVQVAHARRFNERQAERETLSRYTLSRYTYSY